MDRDDLFLIGRCSPQVEGRLSTPRWRIAGSDVIDWREWGDEFVVRVATRSETHLLSTAAGSMLLTLLDRRQALTLDAIYATAIDDTKTDASSNGSSMSAAERESLQAMVADLERLGILVRSAA